MNSTTAFRLTLIASLCVALAATALTYRISAPSAPVVAVTAPAATMAHSWPAERTPDRLRVLFIGNSYTERNGGQAYWLSFFSQGRSPAPIIEQEIGEGWSWADHWEAHHAVERIQEGNWDYVVLQEFSTRPMDSADLMFEYGRKFIAEIRKVGAQPVLLMTWPRLWLISDDLAHIRSAYEGLARETGASVVPAGVVFEKAMEMDPTAHLYEIDGRHPSPSGSYLAACLIYAMVYHTSPVGLPTTAHFKDQVWFSPDDGDPMQLQQAAAAVASQYPPLPMVDHLPATTRK